MCKYIFCRWKKTSDNRKALVESHNIRLQRANYLSKIKGYRAQGRPLVFTDETYLHSSHTIPKQWADDSGKTYTKPLSKGRRLIIVHAGGELGFVPNALLIFKSGRHK